MQPWHFLLPALIYCASTNAQVFKCKDSAGRTVYSDLGCSSQQSGYMFEREKTMEQKYQERVQAYRAQQEKHERKLREQERDMQTREAQAMREAYAPPLQQHKGYAERLQERNDSVRSVFAPPKLSSARSSGQYPSSNTAPPPDILPPPPPPPPPTHLSCKGSWCNDNQGGAYSRSANGRFLHGTSGKTCSMSSNGKWAHCN